MLVKRRMFLFSLYIPNYHLKMGNVDWSWNCLGAKSMWLVQDFMFGILCIFPVWWLGKRLVPLLPIQSIKGDWNGYPLPENIAGPLYPEGYKYGRLVVQVGGWAEGQQPVTLKKAVRKWKIWPGNSRTEWNQPRQWKSINEMRRVPWNFDTVELCANRYW
jgi:hypothetical protein